MSESDSTLPERLPETAPETISISSTHAITTPGLSPEPPPTSQLFFGDDGLRAGWSLLLYLLLLALTGLCASFAVKHFHLIPKNPPTSPGKQTLMQPRAGAIGEMLMFAVVAIPSYLMSLIEKRPFGRYGLPAARMIPDFFLGSLWGFVSLSALMGMLLLFHGITLGAALLHGSVALTYAAKWALVFLFVGLFEEFFFRGYLLYTVSRGVAGIVRTMNPQNPHSHAIGFWTATAIFSVGVFMVLHLGNGGENFAGILAVGLVGIVFAFSLYRTGSLWWAVGWHAAWDWAQSYFYGTADSGTISIGRLYASHPLGSKLLSGGTDGPEGSVLMIPTLLLVALVIHLTLPRRNYFLTPDQSQPVEPGT